MLAYLVAGSPPCSQFFAPGYSILFSVASAKINTKRSIPGPVHTNPFLDENGAVLLCIAPFSKRFSSTLIVFVSFTPVHSTTACPF